jgi:hypothetical protein
MQANNNVGLGRPTATSCILPDIRLDSWLALKADGEYSPSILPRLPWPMTWSSEINDAISLASRKVISTDVRDGAVALPIAVGTPKTGPTNTTSRH